MHSENKDTIDWYAIIAKCEKNCWTFCPASQKFCWSKPDLGKFKKYFYTLYWETMCMMGFFQLTFGQAGAPHLQVQTQIFLEDQRTGIFCIDCWCVLILGRLQGGSTGWSTWFGYSLCLDASYILYLYT